MSRRAFLRSGALAPLPLVGLEEAGAADYANAKEALDAIDRLEVDVEMRLQAIAAALPGARPFVASVLADQRGQRAERARVRRRLGLAAPSPPRPPSTERDLASLRAAQEALVYAHAEGLPALGDAWAVDVLARHLVSTARQLTVIDLWIEAEEARGG
jgi:hypothetical protein